MYLACNCELEQWAFGRGMSLTDTEFLVQNEIQSLVQTSRTKKLHSRFVKTIMYATNVLRELNIEFCVIKGPRHYTYFNSDVNISIAPQDFEKIIRFLEKQGWSRRDRWSQFKENLTERGKRKLVFRDDEKFAEIHLYPGLSWHGFEYLCHETVMSGSQLLLVDGVQTIIPKPVFDIISIFGHCLFERYKLTAGEMFHLEKQMSLLTDEDVEELLLVCGQSGWRMGAEYLIQLVRDSESTQSIDFPLIIEKRVLYRVWRQRFAHTAEVTGFYSALKEVGFNIFWCGPAYAFYSFLKRSFTGSDGFTEKLERLK